MNVSRTGETPADALLLFEHPRCGANCPFSALSLKWFFVDVLNLLNDYSEFRWVDYHLYFELRVFRHGVSFNAIYESYGGSSRLKRWNFWDMRSRSFRGTLCGCECMWMEPNQRAWISFRPDVFCCSHLSSETLLVNVRDHDFDFLRSSAWRPGEPDGEPPLKRPRNAQTKFDAVAGSVDLAVQSAEASARMRVHMSHREFVESFLRVLLHPALPVSFPMPAGVYELDHCDWVRVNLNCYL